MSDFALPALMVEPIVRAALLEDLGRAGDLTTDAIVPADLTAEAVIAARQPGIVAGCQVAALAFRLVDPAMTVTVERPDGSRVASGDVVMRIAGSARALLTGERTALNLQCRLSGIATATGELVDAVRGTEAAVTCTRKTTPGLRALEKAAVRAGGGANHRFGLDDAVLIKDNHIALAGSVTAAIERARARIGHLVKIEVEVDTLQQLEEAMTAAPDVVLLDNMGPETLAKAVAFVDGRAILEASGRITRETARAIAETGVDIVSAGWLTHSSKALDLGLDIGV
ncbi:carboxylating nicotinate-nucleotide diphosphorylase [Amorphus coralli]|uniref:carboxylating nicotinate-nucleotide diphosphorylase n=1 Tax=Amorphus coralli TaxID=340680 RepID=UPI00035C22B6|nr:carboxylating nicotinate-nucleotide diphosphorylase [Amorphus coralli]